MQLQCLSELSNFASELDPTRQVISNFLPNMADGAFTMFPDNTGSESDDDDISVVTTGSIDSQATVMYQDTATMGPGGNHERS